MKKRVDVQKRHVQSEFLTSPPQWSQKVGVKYVAS